MKRRKPGKALAVLLAVCVAAVSLTGCSYVQRWINDVVVNAALTSSERSSASAENTGSDFSIDPAGEGETGFSTSLEDGVLELVNAERKSLSLAELAKDDELKATARERSKELMENNHFEHTRPDGRDWSTIMDEHKYRYTVISENLQKGRASNLTAQDIFDSWKESKSHYAAMIASDVTRTGIGIYVRKSDKGYEWYATEHFSAPR
ncbi:CAP domain-containing protein [Acetanaerobacterium elongatum]|uniref:Uncharacterized conserved protein YkwD, contains CAP (CSP/antigen 5/PR1) domain n=1 Tax=Acetanaerobacterium elongatum TaxID=258515 RepID=A0A1G9UZR8_9FIRM|nr:CAP domain-containing protein [Acetanaerobacterium elongatum]SDM65373.1 Uncharacterized conserved protein YkwD, contains CAP (CSP/antigen 5/PR1) domain [Acetanaerobacterium elongatum]